MKSSSPRICVFLTGASSGIGLAIAQALTADGADVWGTSRESSRLPMDLPGFHPVTLDLNGDADHLRDTFLSAQTEAGGGFDVLINNAGDAWFGPAADLPADALRRQFQTLTFAPFTLVQLALPSMRQAHAGLVINITSIAGRLHLPYASAYNAAKSALSVLTATLRLEEADLGSHVHFVDIQPGDIRTGFNQALSRAPTLDDPSRGDDPAVIGARRTLAVSDSDIASAPPPKIVADLVLRLVRRRHRRSLPAVCTVGMFSQVRLGPLAVRLLPARLLYRTLRSHFGIGTGGGG